MKVFNRTIFFFAAIILLFNMPSAAQEVHIIPKPEFVKLNSGQPFALQFKVQVLYNRPQLQSLADYTVQAIKEWSGVTIGISGNTNVSKNTIRLELTEDIVKNAEGYVLTVNKDAVTIQAATPQGLFYGIQTLLQLIPVNASKNIPALIVKDAPRFPWRGMLFDNCRHIFSVPFIKKFIDQLAYHKLNKFHWHLTEDQGWRIEIKKYPRLQEIAAYRNGTQYGRDRKKDVDTIRYGGYYTQEQIKEVVAYAASRYIEVIPEIEMPGHSVAAITAYPYLACNDASFDTGKPFEVRKVWGVSKDLYCAGNDSVFTFLQDVLTEVMQLFPSQYIHIGGDEAPQDSWKKCPKCQLRMKEEGLKDEAALQSWFIRRMEKFINSKGKKIIGWEEIMQGGLTEGATVHSWLGIESGLKAARLGHDVIMSPYSHLYFDGYQADPKIEPIAIGYWVPLDSVYAFEPVHPDLNDIEAKHILGAQANLWTEFIGSEDYFEYMVFPRIAALAEIDWTAKSQKNYTDFKQRLKSQYQRYARQGIQFRIPTPELITNYHADSSAKIELINPTGVGVIRYATDGSEVTKESAIYQKPIILTKDNNIRFALFYTDGRKSSTDYFPKKPKQKNRP